MQRYRLHSVTERLRQSNKNKVSEQNFCSNESRSSEYFREYGHFKEVTRKDGRIMVKEIVDSVLNKSAGIKVVPSSCCSFVTGFEGSEHMDKRLKQWHDTLRDRARVQMKICERIGRRPQEMLLNQSGTLDQRRKGNFNRIMDYADRLNPTRLKSRQYGVLPAHSDAKHCVCLPEIKQTVPQPERSRVANLEITGLSNTTQNEIFGKINTQTPKSSWINSEEFAKNLNEKADDIDRVIEFFPDVGNLEVIGYNQIPNLNHQSNIDLMHIQSIYSVSSSTEMSSNKLEEHTPPVEVPLAPKVFNVALKINDKEFNMDPNGSMFTSAHFEFHFECSPFERQCKQTMRLENIGRMIFFCEWSLNDTQRMTDSTQLNAHSLYFEKSKFRIYPGDVHVINVMFQPCAVLLSKEHWKLRIFPQIFCNRRSGLTMLLVGKSVASPEYLHKINKQLDLVIDKVRMTTALSLTKLHAALAPIIKPHEQLCPYDRILDEREQFNIQNVGYHCERFDDIETLRALYNDVKMPREPPWDMRLDTIRRFIMRLPEANKREIYFQVLLTVLERLHCASNQRSSMDSDHNNERERSCFIYVRGCIGNGIDEWQDLMMSIEEGCFRTELQHFCKCDSQDSTFKIDAPKNPSQMKLKNEQPAVYVHRMMQSKKYYRDAVYMQTYTQLCDMAENVVSVIESTRCI